MMKKWFLLGVMLLTVFLFTAQASAETVTSLSPAWQPLFIGSDNGTWGLPADLTGIGCGSENETTCEPTGNFVINAPLALPPDGAGFAMIMEGINSDDPGQISDVIFFGNTFGGNGQFLFYSDPNLPTGLSGHDYGIIGYEGGEFGGGFVGLLGTFGLPSGGLLTVEVASDAESVFDPFGYHFDTSDQIKFTGVTPQVPEPATMLLLGIGLAGLGAVRRKLVS